MQQFLSDLDVLGEAFRTVIPLLEARDAALRKEFPALTANVKNAVARVSGKKRGARRLVRSGELSKMVSSVERLIAAVRKLNRATSMYRRQTLVLLVARLDEYTGELLKVEFKAKPELLKGADRTLPLDMALAAESLDELVATVVGSETDKILRGSQSSQVDYFDKKFKLGLRENFASYGDFIEVVERRHLFVHTGARLTGQYLAACESAGKSLESKKLGTVLPADDEYLARAGELIFEYGFRLGQSLHRRLFPSDLGSADRAIIDYGINLIGEQRWMRAETVFQFAHSLPEKFVADDSTRRIFMVNLAIALQGQGRVEEAMRLLDSVDWSSAHPKFTIVLAALRKEYARASNLMKSNRDAISEEDYRQWPAFRDFRRSAEFEAAFMKIFRKPFMPQLPSEAELPNSGLQSAKAGA